MAAFVEIFKSSLSLYSLQYAVACNELAGPSPRNCGQVTQLLSKICCSGGKRLAKLSPIWPARDFNHSPSAPETNALPLDFIWLGTNFYIAGSLTLDLNRLTRGAKSSNKCTLSLAADENNSEDIPMISLFKQRRIKGWWPFTAKNDQDQLEITVSKIIFNHWNIEIGNQINMNFLLYLLYYAESCYEFTRAHLCVIAPGQHSFFQRNVAIVSSCL